LGKGTRHHAETGFSRITHIVVLSKSTQLYWRLLKVCFICD